MLICTLKTKLKIKLLSVLETAFAINGHVKLHHDDLFRFMRFAAMDTTPFHLTIVVHVDIQQRIVQ